MKAAAVSTIALSAALAVAVVSGCAAPRSIPVRVPAASTAVVASPVARPVAPSRAASTAGATPTPKAAAAAKTAVATPRSAARRSVAATVSPCQRNTDAQLILVVISEQRASACSRAEQVYVSPVTTGDVTTGDDTPTGTWQVQSKQTDRTLTLLNGSQYFVRYWMPYDDIYGFHDASWQTVPFGSAQYRTAGSHGCVHLPTAAMAWLYHWADIGATVTIRS
jgi:lipoprotein-anchoring transpeptidase ErfK/SrfK